MSCCELEFQLLNVPTLSRLPSRSTRSRFYVRNPISPWDTTLRSILILSPRLRLGLPSGLFLSGFPTNILYTTLFSPIRTTCHVHLIILDFITRTIFREEYRSLSSSLCSFLHSSYVQIFSSAPYSKTPSAYVPSSVRV